MVKPNCWKRLASGKYVDLNNLREEDINLSDIETSLNYIIRFTGHWKDVEPLTVAQHSYLCLKLAQMMEPEDRELHRAVFIHDFAETYIGDVATPVKKAMGDKWYEFSKPIEDFVTVAVNGQLFSEDVEERVKLYDLLALDIERRVMWKSQYGKSYWPNIPLELGTIKTKEDLFHSIPEYINIKDVWESL